LHEPSNSSLRSRRAQSSRSERQHKAWGASPRINESKIDVEPAKRATACDAFGLSPTSRAQSRFLRILGLAPQALYCRLLRRLGVALILVLITSTTFFSNGAAAGWRIASEPELRKVIPGRAPVIKENIETEFRTASGVTDGRGKFIAGVVMITAGYSAEGKYSHFFVAQVPMKVGEFSLEPGEYVFGYQRKTPDSITVTFYRASSGDTVGEVEAFRNRKSSMVRALLIQPATGGKGTIQVGRFVFDYHVD